MVIALLLAFITIAFIVFSWIEISNMRKLPMDWKENNQQEAKNMLVEDITRAKDRILIYGGDGLIYDETEILEALQRQTCIIEMIFENKDVFSSRLGQLAKKRPNIIIRTVDKDFYKHHFRVIDYNYIYLEKRHLPKAEHRYYKRLNNVKYLPGIYSKDFYKIRERALAVAA